MLKYAPLGPTVSFWPNVQAHLSAFSAPLESAQPEVGLGSVLVSSNSCAMTETMASTPALPLGPGVWAQQPFKQRAALPTKEYLIFEPEIVPHVCQPQYFEQKPEFSATF